MPGAPVLVHLQHLVAPHAALLTRGTACGQSELFGDLRETGMHLPVSDRDQRQSNGSTVVLLDAQEDDRG